MYFFGDLVTTFIRQILWVIYDFPLTKIFKLPSNTFPDELFKSENQTNDFLSFVTPIRLLFENR